MPVELAFRQLELVDTWNLDIQGAERLCSVAIGDVLESQQHRLSLDARRRHDMRFAGHENLGTSTEALFREIRDDVALELAPHPMRREHVRYDEKVRLRLRRRRGRRGSLCVWRRL